VSLTLKSGQEALVFDTHFEQEIIILEDGARVGNIVVPRGTVICFMKKEADKRGLVAVPQENAHVFKLRRKRIYAFLHWLEMGLLYVPRW
jgi:hypothetical protein